MSKKHEDSEAVIAPKQARGKQTRERIFQAAREVFAAKGYDRARVSDITRRAGVSKQRLYAYFGSKRALYREVLLSVYADVASDEGLSGLSVCDLPHLTERIVEQFFRIHEENPRFWRLLAWENLHGGRGLASADWERIRGSYIAHIETLYHLGQDRGFFRADVDFTTYLLILFSTTYFCFSNQLTISHLLGLALDQATVRRHIEEQFADLMYRGTVVHPHP